ncbi:MAG: hypothetical protein ACRDS0_36855 [Pseudonocardiaceae bacterium]
MTPQPGDQPVSQWQFNTAQSGGVVYAVQNGNQYVYLYRHKPPYRVEPLPAGPPPVPDLLARRAPSWLLSARYQVVPFYGREAELAWLQDWRDNPMRGLSVRLVHASSGQGKTRLATQFAEVCTQQGWTVAVVRHRSDAATASGTDQQLAVNHRGLVLIVDYAERWPLLDMLTLLHQHQAAASTPVRALLLARSAGGWWQLLVHQLSNYWSTSSAMPTSTTSGSGSWRRWPSIPRIGRRSTPLPGTASPAFSACRRRQRNLI